MNEPAKRTRLPRWAAAGLAVAVAATVAAGVVAAGVIAGEASRLTPLIAALCVLAGVLLGGAAWRRQRTENRHRREAFHADASNRALLARFEHMVDQANDMILLVDDRLRIVEANDRATDTYGYGHEALLKLRLPDLLP